jgi:hypothetical protein
MENRLSDLKSELTNDMEEVNQRLEEMANYRNFGKQQKYYTQYCVVESTV